MAEISASTSTHGSTTVTDLDVDSLVQCASYLSLQDLCNMAITCKLFKIAAYSDSIWHHLFREKWPEQMLCQYSPGLPFRDAYLARRTAVLQFSFVDSLVADFYSDSRPFSHVLLGKDNIIFSQGSCIRCFRGHSGPVSTLSDKLLGDIGRKVLASGGEDGTVRLWSLSSSGKRGQHALNAKLYGHEKPVKLITVAWHKPSLLISIATDSKIRVWDSTLASASRTSSCMGMASVPGAPVGIKCFDSMLYVAAGSSVHAIDFRTMKKAFTAAVCQPDLYSFEMLPSRSLVCTGGSNRALLWDIRKSQEGVKPRPMAELDGHNGPVTHVHMDPYKIVTGGPDDYYVHVWEAETGALKNSLQNDSELSNVSMGCNAMAVDGSRIVTTSCGEEGHLRFRDFGNASCSVSSYEDAVASKFWNSKSYNDSDSDV